MNTTSSNPFRRSAHSSEYTSAGEPSEDVYDAHAAVDKTNDPALQRSTTTANTTSSSTKKTVRISSPPRSPSPRREDDGALLASHSQRSYHDASAYPSTRHPPNHSRHGHTSSSGDDSSSSDDDDGPEVMGTQHVAADPRGATNVPHNPFSRTLADMEDSLGTTAASSKAPDLADQRGSGTSQLSSNATPSARAAMDVNAFKNLLMTGKPPPPQPQSTTAAATSTAAATEVPAQRHPITTLADNSSGTDTSSVSRQSLADASMANSTPRTSYERSLSDDEDDEEEDAVVPPQRTASMRVKPPLPRHRHGKSVTATGPQIVSFNDFTSFGKEEGVKSPVEERQTRASGEFRRPLPPIPQPAAVARAETMPTPSPPASSVSTEQRDVSPHTETPSEQTSQSKKPPPPPLARRSSQRAPMTSAPRPRSNTASSRPSLMEDNESIAESTSSSTRIAPPPPPARRSGHSISTADEGSPSSINRAPSLKSPPPPPARNRASSNQSATSIPSTLSTTPTASAPPTSTSSTSNPPPRPPPRRTSSRSSIDIVSPRRTSGEMVRSSFDSERRPSMSNSVRRVPITEEPYSESAIAGDSTAAGEGLGMTSPSAKDILADMDRFQKEIDALMAKDEIGKRKGSGGSASMQRPAR